MTRILTKADVSDLIGKPFALRASGPDAYSCLGLVIELCWRDQSGINIPRDISRTKFVYCWGFIDLCRHQGRVPISYADNCQSIIDDLVQWRPAAVEPGAIVVSGGHISKALYDDEILNPYWHFGYALSEHEIIHADPIRGVVLDTPEGFSAGLGEPSCAAFRHNPSTIAASLMGQIHVLASLSGLPMGMGYAGALKAFAA